MSWTERLAVFDTETTGTNPLSDRIVTAFVGIIDANGEARDLNRDGARKRRTGT